jgi:GAF domain-containing protein
MEHTIDRTMHDGSVIAPAADEPAGDRSSDDEHMAATRAEFIAATLTWCAGLFGVTRVRFVCQSDAGDWRVYTWQRETVVTHAADYAEIAMVYMVGLGRQPLLVGRPRISRSDGSGLRPIAITSYLGIPIVVQDRLVGVVELAGDVGTEVETTLHSAVPRLTNAGARLLYDPRLTLRPRITADSTLVLDAATWTTDEIRLTPEELSLLERVIGPTTITAIADAAGIAPSRAVELAVDLAQRGLVAVHDGEEAPGR